VCCPVLALNGDPIGNHGRIRDRGVEPSLPGPGRRPATLVSFVVASMFQKSSTSYPRGCEGQSLWRQSTKSCIIPLYEADNRRVIRGLLQGAEVVEDKLLQGLHQVRCKCHRPVVAELVSTVFEEPGANAIRNHRLSRLDPPEIFSHRVYELYTSLVLA
ncbi:unnamed protein product, partial [Pleuronectes platessa]